MKTIKTLLISLAIAAVALGQQSPAGPNVTFNAGPGAASTRTCNDSAYVGSIWTQTTNGGVTSVCQQTGASSLGQGAFGWVTSFVASVSGGTLTITSGKTPAFSNSLTLAGTDSTTMTFPTTSATLARTDAANTFTGTQTVGALVATTINGNTFTTGTATLTLAGNLVTTGAFNTTFAQGGSATMTLPTTSATLARTDAGQTFTGVQTFSSAPVIASITNTGTETLPTTTGGIPVVIGCGATSGANVNCANTALGATVRSYFGKATLASNSSVITFSPGFTDTTYVCLANDTTTRANPVQVASTSATTATITNTTGASDVIFYACFGN